MNGLGLESFLEDTVTASGNTHLTIVETNQQIELLTGSEHETHEEERTTEKHTAEEITGVDPHIWLSLPNAITQVNIISTALQQADPKSAHIYQANTVTYIQKLEVLNAYAHNQLDTISHPEFIALHPAWAYFAHEYNLEQVGTIEVIPGQEPSAQDVAELLHLIDNHHIVALFAEPQLPSNIVKTLSSDTGLPIYSIDPEGSSVQFDAQLYENVMKQNIDTFADALK
jgi:zinc transport system substrate-binding protein